MVMIPAWRNAHPDCSSSKSELNSYYTNIIRQAYGGTVEIEGNEDKIIRRIAKEVAIEKTAWMFYTLISSSIAVFVISAIII